MSRQRARRFYSFLPRAAMATMKFPHPRKDRCASLPAGLCAALYLCATMLPGCRMAEFERAAGIKPLLPANSASEDAIRAAAIKDTTFPTATQPIPKS